MPVVAVRVATVVLWVNVVGDSVGHGDSVPLIVSVTVGHGVLVVSGIGPPTCVASRLAGISEGIIIGVDNRELPGKVPGFHVAAIDVAGTASVLLTWVVEITGT
jgi:hypothetical protein